MKNFKIVMTLGMLASGIAHAQMPDISPNSVIAKAKVKSRIEAVQSCAQANDQGKKWRLMTALDVLIAGFGAPAVQNTVLFKAVSGGERPDLLAFWLGGMDERETKQLNETPTSVFMFNGSLDGPPAFDVVKDIQALEADALKMSKSKVAEESALGVKALAMARSLQEGVSPICIDDSLKFNE